MQLLIACHRRVEPAVKLQPDTEPRAQAQRSAEPAASVAPGALASLPAIASPAAFDLIATPRGAVVAWAPANGANVVLLQLDAWGRALGDARAVAKITTGATVVELALAAESARRVGLVFVESTAASSRTYSMLADLDAPAAAKPDLIATSAGATLAGRGRVGATSLAGGRVRVIYASGPTRCIDGATGPCTGFGFRELEEPPPSRQEPWLSVPLPCARGAASVASLEGRWYYALCSLARGTASTTAYSINLETAYARADEVLAGCTPLGMTPIDAATLLLGAECGSARRAARLTLEADPAVEISLADLRLECDGQRATLRTQAWGLPLDVAHDRLEAILPQALAPLGSRAVATGSAVLVAEPRSQGLVLSRYRCERGVLQSEPRAAHQTP
jgi:hypothetical protein